MSRRAEYHLVTRFVISPEQVEAVRAVSSPSARTVWVSMGMKGGRRQERLKIYTLKGVPGKYVDVLMPDIITGLAVCEIGRKAGCYDGAIRWRITIRHWPTEAREGKAPSLLHPGPGKLILDEDLGETIVFAHWTPTSPEDTGAWVARFPRLRFTVHHDTDLLGIFIHQAKNWFKFLWRTQEEDVRQAAALWAALPAVAQCEDIVVLNRLASEALYDLATQSGWKKLTLRDKRRYGLADDSPQWVRTDSMILRQGWASRSGAGEYTERAANGDRLYIRTAHGVVDLES